MSQNITTNEVRLSYYHADKPFSNSEGQEPKYSVTVLVPKHDVATKAQIDAAIAAAIEEGVNSNWNNVRPPVPPIPVYDGDGVRPSDGAAFGEECRGHWVFTASSKQPVQVVDQNVQPIIQPGVMYSGVYARVNISFYAYAHAGKKGIGCGLNAIQKMRDGEPLSGSTVDVKQCFGAVPQAAAPQFAAPAQQGYAQAAPMQQGYAAPQAPAQYAAPAQTMPAQQGYPQAAPMQQGYADPQAQYAAAPQAAPMQQGYPQAAPMQQGYPQGYAQPGVVPGMPVQG